MLGPIEIVVIAFPGSHFKGEIIPVLADLVDTGTITIVDGLLAVKDADGSIDFVEIDELGGDPDAAALSAVLDRSEGLLSNEDIQELLIELEPGSSAAVLVFEHTWVKPFRDAIINADGVLLQRVQVPGVAVEIVLAALAELPDED